MESKRTYSEEFKRNAIQVLETSGKRLTEVERDLGIPHGLLRKWQRRFQVNPVSAELELSEVARLEAEVRALKRELEITRMEREILKKTVSSFSKESR